MGDCFAPDPPNSAIKQNSVNTPLRNPIDDDFGSELYLTPMLQLGNATEARKKSRVQNLTTDIESYSGYLTVNKLFNSNMFFWFFPSIKCRESAPVILWLQGGPGSSSLIGLFNGFGPFSVNDKGILQPQTTTWISNHSVIFIDNPVGAGLSFTDDEAGYVTNQGEVCRDLYEALTQFFQIFPDFRAQDFYVAGQSYAGKYIPHLGVKLHNENLQAPAHLQINLKGLVIGSSFTDPYVQLQWGEFLFNMGLIDHSERKYFELESERMRNFIHEKNWFPAFQIMQNLMFAFPPPMTSHYEVVTGLSNTFNLLESCISEVHFNYRKFLASPSTRKSIHVGKRQLDFGKTKEKVFMALAEDMPKSARPELEKVLDLGYRVLLYSSQFDVVVPHTAVTNLLNSLSWVGAKEFANSKRRIWRVQNESAGFVKEAQNLVHFFIRNSGHMSTYDAPEWCFNMLTRFTRNLTHMN